MVYGSCKPYLYFILSFIEIQDVFGFLSPYCPVFPRFPSKMLTTSTTLFAERKYVARIREFKRQRR